ncbi:MULTISPECIES: serine/threonine protein kinase [unclassified Nocardiopsis]|uniref:serine/threonine protein kinase n=1 Tax=Nocardiopsis TaxID=2013 RepID=UPI00387B43BA
MVVGAVLPGGFSPLRADDPLVVGPFPLVGRIGAGGMGVVYGALGPRGERIAVKVILPAHAGDPDFRERFAHEAALLARVDADCAPAFHGADPGASTPWMATDFVPGRTLKEHVAERGVLSGEALAAFAAGTAEALAAVHAAGVLHRDVKPANVILSPAGPRMLDFGIARDRWDTSPEKQVLGTAGWVAPERLSGAAATDRSDVYAWGGLVVYAATGRGPFGSGTRPELLRRAREEEPDLAGVPEPLLGVVGAALSRDPALRPTAAQAMAAVLALVPGTETEPRRRLRALIGRAWRGFTDAGRGVGDWVPAESAAPGSEAREPSADHGSTGHDTAGYETAGHGSTGHGAATAKASGGGLRTLTAVAAGAALIAVVGTAGWIAGRVAADEPVLPTSAEPSASPSPAADEQASGTQEVVFGALTLEVPADWTVHRYDGHLYESAYADPVRSDLVILGTDPAIECRDIADGSSMMYPDCPHVQLHGEGGLATGRFADAFEPGFKYNPANQPYPCPKHLPSTPAEPTAVPQDPRSVAEETVDGAPVLHVSAEGGCHDHDYEDDPFGTGEFMAAPYALYVQDSWYFGEQRILVVDDYATEGLTEIIGAARVSG